MKKLGKTSVLTLIAALFVFAFAGTAFAEETEGIQPEQLTQMVEHELPVGGWAPAEPIYVPTDLVVNGSDSSDGLLSSKTRINSDPNAVFTKGKATTGYKALNAAQKKLYNAIDAAVIEFLNAKTDLPPTETTVKGEDVDRYIISEIDYSEMGIAGGSAKVRTQNALKAFYAYDYDHPAYYWLSNEILYNECYLYPCTEPEYAGVSTRRALNALVSNSVKAYADFAGNGTTLDKVALIHDKIINDIDYAYQEDGETPEEAKWAHGVHGVFDPHYKLAVCEGYADAFALIMNYLGIPNYYIVGEAGDGGPGGGDGHAWNAVYDDDTKQYLYMDLTWDDWGEDGYSYEYFGMPLTNFESQHREYKADATKAIKWLYNIDGEYNDSISGTYYVRGEYYYDKSTSDANKFAAAAKAKAARAGGWVSVLCTDEESIDEITPALGVTKSDIVTYKDDEGDNYNCAYLIAPALAGGSHSHAWTDPTYIWEPDGSQVSAIRICKAPNCDTITEMETVGAAYNGTEPTCTEAGQGICSAVFENVAFSVEPKEVTREALGHDWGKTTYTWSGYSKVTAKRECSRQAGDSCTETETAKTTSKVTRKATYTAKGQTTYTASFTNPDFKASKTLTNIPKLAKKTNPMKVKATAQTLKYKKLKKKALVVAPIAVTSAKGKVTYKVVGGNTKSKKALSLNTKTGKVTVKKKTKKGKYQIKVKVSAAGTSAYKVLSKTVTVTVNVK